MSESPKKAGADVPKSEKLKSRLFMFVDETTAVTELQRDESLVQRHVVIHSTFQKREGAKRLVAKKSN